jgi:hypothetical protein
MNSVRCLLAIADVYDNIQTSVLGRFGIWRILSEAVARRASRRNGTICVSLWQFAPRVAAAGPHCGEVQAAESVGAYEPASFRQGYSTHDARWTITGSIELRTDA